MRERERKRKREGGSIDQRSLKGGRGKEGGSMDQRFPEGERERERERGREGKSCTRTNFRAPSRKQEVWACSMCSSFSQSVRMRDYIIHGARMSENDTSRSIIDDLRVTLQIVASLLGSSWWLSYVYRTGRSVMMKPRIFWNPIKNVSLLD